MSRVNSIVTALVLSFTAGPLAFAQTQSSTVVAAVTPAKKSSSKEAKPAVLSFKDWKDSQVVEAKNQVVRLSNRIILLKKGVLKVEAEKKDSTAVNADLGTDRVRTSDNRDMIVEAEAQLKSALESLQFTTELNLKDYFAVYLSRFKDQPEALSLAAQKLSKEEVVELLQVSMKEEASGTAGTGERNASQIRGALMESLSAKPL